MTEMRTREKLVEEIKACGESIINNAESIVGGEQYLTDLTVTIYINFNEVTRINIDRNFAPEGVIYANQN